MMRGKTLAEAVFTLPRRAYTQGLRPAKKRHMEHRDEIQRKQKKPVACGYDCHKEQQLRSGTSTAHNALLVGEGAASAAAGMHHAGLLSVRLQAL
jgi:hypothetical protein